jgi:hypothetical protein
MQCHCVTASVTVRPLYLDWQSRVPRKGNGPESVLVKGASRSSGARHLHFDMRRRPWLGQWTLPYTGFVIGLAICSVVRDVIRRTPIIP